MRCRIALALGIGVSLAAGCAASRSETPRTDPDVITFDQIARSRVTNAYDVIATLRPRMFTAHGAPTTRQATGRRGAPVVVYVDKVRFASVEELKGLLTGDVREIRYLSPRVATDRWGPNHAGGVIYVTTLQAVGPDTTD
jgi:hypothetical protein